MSNPNWNTDPDSQPRTRRCRKPETLVEKLWRYRCEITISLALTLFAVLKIADLGCCDHANSVMENCENIKVESFYVRAESQNHNILALPLVNLQLISATTETTAVTTTSTVAEPEITTPVSTATEYEPPSTTVAVPEVTEPVTTVIETEVKVTESFTTEQEALLNIIRQVCENRSFDFAVAKAFATVESSINANALRYEDDGTKSYGMFQINDILLEHYGYSVDDAYDPHAATEIFISHLSSLIKTYGRYDAFRAYQTGEAGMRAGNGHTYAKKIWALVYG